MSTKNVSADNRSAEDLGTEETTGRRNASSATGRRNASNRGSDIVLENPSIVLATTILTSLISEGVRWVAYCPGSRDAPFGYALANLERAGRVRAAVFSDERSAGFWAVGAAKARHEPVAIVTTSGTAAAELHPALEEAWFQSLPIVALTADRPHELRGVGASQTTHQVGIFDRSVVVSDELPAEFLYDNGTLARVVGRVRRMVAASRGFLGQAGPVHLNVAFREPLVPAVGALVPATGAMVDTARADSGAPDSHHVSLSGGVLSSGGCTSQGPSDGLMDAVSGAQVVPPAQLGQPSSVIASRVRHPMWDEVVQSGLRTLVVAGDGAYSEVVAVAAKRGIPIIAEPSSNATAAQTWIPYEQWIVPQLGDRVEQIVVTGRPTLSRPITQLLGRSLIRKIVVATHPEWVDVHETADVVVAGLSDDAGFDGSVAAERRDSDGSNNRQGAPGIVQHHAPRVAEGCDSAAPDANSWLDVWRAAAASIDEILGESADMTDSFTVAHLPTSNARAESGEPMGSAALSGDHTSSDLTLLSACRAVWRHSDSALLWLGASNTVRGFDLVANRPGRADVHSNRGLAGIDGTIASALGLAMASGRPVRAIMGDMTFAYDLSSLAQRPELPDATPAALGKSESTPQVTRTPGVHAAPQTTTSGESSSTTPNIQVIVLDDCGGSIFASLEHRDAEPAIYERFFAAAPNVDPVAAARACGWEARKIETLVELHEALVAPIMGRSLLHLRIPRPSAQLDAARTAAANAVAEALGQIS
ncbi:MAG: thiamine pyrophosphate-binding protein [Ancrocorticia sp.]